MNVRSLSVPASLQSQGVTSPAGSSPRASGSLSRADLPPTVPASVTLERQGLELADRRDWRRALGALQRAVEFHASMDPLQALSPRGLAALGLARVFVRRSVREGLVFCEVAAKRDFYEPEILYCLAEAYLAAGQRSRAAGALRRGLLIDPHHAGLREINSRIGVRRPPVFRFLARRHLLNVLIGRARQRLRGAVVAD